LGEQIIVNNLDSNLPVDTPDNILLDAEIAGFGTRCVAALIDYLMLTVLLLVFTLLAVRSIRGASVGAAALIIFQFVLITFYHLFFEIVASGQTPGKRWVGIRVVQANGLPLTPTGAIVRNLVRLFDFLPLMYGIGLLVMFATKHTQRLGDLAAGTVVIREQGRLTTRTIKAELVVHYRYTGDDETIPPYIQVDRLEPGDYQIIVNYLGRRSELQEPHRQNVARMLARRFSTQMSEPSLHWQIETDSAQAERFLEFVARAFEQTTRTGGS
jgi:uncharacterized RDD family membrane protein YckC